MWLWLVDLLNYKVNCSHYRENWNKWSGCLRSTCWTLMINTEVSSLHHPFILPSIHYCEKSFQLPSLCHHDTCYWFVILYSRCSSLTPTSLFIWVWDYNALHHYNALAWIICNPAVPPGHIDPSSCIHLHFQQH